MSHSSVLPLRHFNPVAARSPMAFRLPHCQAFLFMSISGIARRSKKVRGVMVMKDIEVDPGSFIEALHGS